MLGLFFNKVNTNSVEIAQLRENLTNYFNLLSLFFPMSVNITVWTMAHALPYHASLLYDNYKIGYCIISLQAKMKKKVSLRGNPALDHDNNTNMTYHEYQGIFDIALVLKKLSKVAQ